MRPSSPLRYALSALVVALVFLASGVAAAATTDPAPEQCDAPLVSAPPESTLASTPESGRPPVFLPSDDTCDPSYQVDETSPAMCSTSGTSEVAPRIVHPTADATLDAPKRCDGPELGLGTSFDRDDQPRERAPSAALEACLFRLPHLAPLSEAVVVPTLRPRDVSGRQTVLRIDRPPRP